MANWTVIEGGGGDPPDRDAVFARQALRMMIVEVLRALARGNDPELRIVNLLVDFTKHANSMKTPLWSVIAEVISEMNKEVVREGARDDGEGGIEDIIRSALAVAGELCTDDGFAKARISKKMGYLRFDIEQHIIARETMARSNGRSYLLPLIKRKFPKERKGRAKEPRGDRGPAK
jgi:hypothetical protein